MRAGARAGRTRLAALGAGRRSLRLGLTLSSILAAAAFLLVSATAASAAPGDLHVKVRGEADGKVITDPAAAGDVPNPTPLISCEWAWEAEAQSGACDAKAELSEPGGPYVAALEAVPPLGSEIEKWVMEGTTGKAPTYCEEGSLKCRVYSFGGELKVRAVFKKAAPLKVLKGGSGQGTVTSEPSGINCDPACTEKTAKFGVGEVVKLKAAAQSGSQFSGWSAVSGDPGTCTGATSPCEIQMSEAKEIEAAFALETRALAIAESGPGSVAVQCEEGAGFEACAKPLSELDYGTEVRVTASPDPGAKVKSLSGTNSASGCTKSACEFTLTKDSEVTVAFAPIVISPLEVTVTGQGAVTIEPPGLECTEAGNGTPACEEEFEDGETIALEAKAAEGWLFAEWTEGPCAGETGASCDFAMPAEAVQAAALFEEINGVQLTVVKGGHPEGGTVVSIPAGISCGLACEVDTEIFQKGATVTLTAAARKGYAFGGWIGCRYAGPGACEVTLTALLTEVTAVFVKDGEGGEAGEDGKGVTVTPEPPGANCPNGGVKVESASGTKYVCNGKNGEGGAEGSQGSAGQDGAAGRNGQNGAPGAQGPPGPRGARGPAGKVRMTCEVKRKGSKVEVACKVHRAKESKRANRHRRVRWALMRDGHAVSHGETTIRRLQRALNRLRPGHYVLHVRGQKGGISVVR